MGAHITFENKRGPVIEKNIDILTLDDIESAEYIEKTIKNVKSQLSNTPLIGFAGSPFHRQDIQRGRKHAWARQRRHPKSWLLATSVWLGPGRHWTPDSTWPKHAHHHWRDAPDFPAPWRRP